MNNENKSKLQCKTYKWYNEPSKFDKYFKFEQYWWWSEFLNKEINEILILSSSQNAVDMTTNKY